MFLAAHLSRFSSLRAAVLVAVLAQGVVVRAQQLTLASDTVLDSAALLMPAGSTYGRAINGLAFQQEALMTYGGYQYAAWYHLGATDEDLYLARRNLSGGAWETFDTGKNFDNGDAGAWDAHNVVSFGIAGDGSIHVSWDHHGHTLRYMSTGPGAATGATWNASLLGAERNTLVVGASAITTVTYPRFVTNPTNGNLTMEYRNLSSGSGNSFVATYDTTTGTWNAPHQYINGTQNITYSDPYGANSTDRNAYLNGIDYDANGRLHATWTWREQATGSSNHDILYAFSDDGGDTWKNNAGAIVGTTTTTIKLNSPGIVVVPLDRGNTLMNQQTQAVDQDGRVHMIMWHKTDEAAPVTGFTTAPAAYFHYVRDPATGVWTRNALPASTPVGLRPDMAYDENGNLYAAYVSPGAGDAGNYYTSGDLIIAAASKASGYADWEVVYRDTRDFISEPRIDQQRLLTAGKLSIFEQENNAAVTTATGTALRVMEFNKLANLVVWAGDHGGTWQNGPGANWDNDNDNVGDAAFADGYRVLFDDGAASTSVNVASAVAPASTTFRNSAAKSFTISGAGIGGPGGLTLAGGGNVTLANAPSNYAGPTAIDSGVLTLTGPAAITNSPAITVGAGATLNASGTSAGGITLASQSLTVDGAVVGSVTATGASVVALNSTTGINGNVALQGTTILTGAGDVHGSLAAQAGTTIRVGGDGLPSITQTPVTLLDNFTDGTLSEYTLTAVNDQAVAQANVAYSAAGGSLSATFTGAAGYEQTLLLRGDRSLAIGETLRVDVAMPSSTLQMDLGLAISTTAAPVGAGASDADTRDLFDWASVSLRPSADNIRVNRSIGGVIDTTTGAASGVVETAVSGLFITRVSETDFAVGYRDSSAVDNVRSVISFPSGGPSAAVGFYGDLRSAGTLGAFDNLRIEGTGSTIRQGETLTVDGNVTLAPGTTLALDASDPGAVDRLTATGQLTLGGTLTLALAPAAPTPTLGDTFDILDFAAASGAFDAYHLPTLASGLAWSVSKLTTNGQLSVVVDVDFNDDGLVDGGDFLGLQRTAPALMAAWQAQYGGRIAISTPPTLNVVPEPAAWALVVATLPAVRLTTCRRRRRRSDRPARNAIARL